MGELKPTFNHGPTLGITFLFFMLGHAETCADEPSSQVSWWN